MVRFPVLFHRSRSGSRSADRRFTMLRCMRMAVGLVLIGSMAGGEARAQWGYGGWGWGGWGGGGTTAQSAALQGAGNYAMGAGVYNLDTAQARSINAQTASQWNDYVA